MNDLEELGDAIEAKLAVVEARRVRERQAEERQRLQLACRRARFAQLAKMLTEDVVGPRIEKLVSFFANAEVVPPDETDPYRGRCLIRHSSDFPASVRLELRVDHDSEIENIRLVYDLEILPVFFRFRGDHGIVVSIDSVDRWQIADWVDQHILEFVDTYLEIPRTPQYCGETTGPDAFSANKIPQGPPSLRPLRLSCPDRATA